MKKGYDYQGKVRKEVWLTKTVLKKLERKAKADKRDLKIFMEMKLEEAANDILT